MSKWDESLNVIRIPWASGWLATHSTLTLPSGSLSDPARMAAVTSVGVFNDWASDFSIAVTSRCRAPSSSARAPEEVEADLAPLVGVAAATERNEQSKKHE
jgi:hypothetical protein